MDKIIYVMTKNNKKQSGGSLVGASGDAPTRQFNASRNAPLRESVNAPTNSSKGKTVSSKLTADD